MPICMGETGRSSTLTASLAEVLYRQGRLEEASELAHLASTMAAEDDVATQVTAGYVRGRVLAAKGSLDDGERFVREAWELAEGTGYLLTRADAAEAVADVLALAGRTKESREFLERALELHEQKGNVILAERTRRALAAGPGSSRA
jgi:tetratricopeptide (TPR) repeat protein